MYRFLRGIGRIIFLIRRWRVIGRENVPATGGVIIAANHSSSWDPILLGCAINREIYYMGKEELFSHPLGAWFFTSVHAFPVKRGSADRKAIRNAIDILQQGLVLGIFPEGTRVESGHEVQPQSGIALLALKARVPVVPVGLKGSRYGVPQVVVGKVINLDQYYEMKPNSALLEIVSKEIMMEVNQLVQAVSS